jgi:hypothetical protein
MGNKARIQRKRILGTAFQRLARKYLTKHGFWPNGPTPKRAWMLAEVERLLGYSVPAGMATVKRIEQALAALGEAVPDEMPVKLPRLRKDGFYNSPAWKRARYAALRKNDGRCELCGASKHDGATLHVDHILPRSKFPKLALEPTNLQVLCEPCNLGKSNTDETDWRPPAEPTNINQRARVRA